jgi:hypothetical protein
VRLPLGPALGRRGQPQIDRDPLVVRASGRIGMGHSVIARCPGIQAEVEAGLVMFRRVMLLAVFRMMRALPKPHLYSPQSCPALIRDACSLFRARWRQRLRVLRLRFDDRTEFKRRRFPIKR